MQQTCFRQYLFNLARLTVAVGLTIGLSGIAMFLLFGRLSGAFGNFLFLAAVLLPVLVCTRGFEKKPFRSVGLTARRCDPGWFFFGVLWAAAWMAVILLVVCLLLGRGDFPIALQQAANGPRLVHYLIVGFCEELLFRGYLFQNLFCEWPFWRRSLLSAILFTLPHSLNANGDAGLQILAAFLFGLLANYLVFRTESIWMGVGLHWMWNALAVSFFYDQGTQAIAAPMFPLVFLLCFPLLRRMFDRWEWAACQKADSSLLFF